MTNNEPLNIFDIALTVLIAALVLGACRALTDEPRGRLIPVTVSIQSEL